MDILAVLFLIFGWIFRVKGLVIAAIALASFITVWQVVMSVMKGMSEKSKSDSKSDFKEHFTLVFNFILLALTIIKICIW